ncbi:antibiotic biosynthesis monooxygenase [Nocardioidaceae bacterium]|nr:antibiotic biosynthesis monooxygenase [Nocardioidaceae bacterium]
MSPIDLPEPPYTVVVFTSRLRSDLDDDARAAYDRMSARMEILASEQPGYLGVESARGDDLEGITCSYWVDDAAAVAWKQVTAHLLAQERGRQDWYADYRVRVATVTRAYGKRA